MQRVITYIDGFNLYFGLKSKGWKRYYWLDMPKLAQNLLKPDQQLVLTKYFTARITGSSDKQKRQNTYLEALETLRDLSIYYGKYQANQYRCRACGSNYIEHHEKMTDVNIATQLMCDAFGNAFDVALLVSGDGDLCNPLSMIRALFPTKRVIVAFPPERYSYDLVRLADAYFTIGRAKIAASLLAETIVKPDGSVLKCPPEWS